MPEWEAIYDSAKLVREVIASIAEIVEEGNFYVKETGLEFSAMDESRVAMAILNMPREIFQKYDVAFDGDSDTIVLGVNFTDLKKVMRRGGAKDMIKLALKRERDRNYFAISFMRETVPEQTADERIFYLPLLDIPEERLNIGKLEYDVVVELSPANYLREIFEDAKVFGEDIRIIADMDTKELRFEVESEIGQAYKRVIKLEQSDAVVTWEIKDSAESLYSLDFLSKMAKVAKSSDLVKISFSRERPLLISYQIGGGIELSYLLAPRLL